MIWTFSQNQAGFSYKGSRIPEINCRAGDDRHSKGCTWCFDPIEEAMTQTDWILKPNDAVRVKYDCGEFYPDFPAQVVLVASQGSTGRVVSLDEFKKDFVRHLRQNPSIEHQQAYLAHFAVVGQAMAEGLQYPVRFEKVAQPIPPADLLCARVGEIGLVDGAALEKAGSGGVGDTIAAMFKGQPSAAPVSAGKIIWPAGNTVHDQAKFTDLELALVLSQHGRITPVDAEIIYFHYTSMLPYHNDWYRLKRVVPEAAFDIIDTLHFPKHNHAGYSWEEIADMLEKNDPRKPLWYTHDQSEALIFAAQKIYKVEQERGFEALSTYTDPDVIKQLENNPDVSRAVVDILKKDKKK
jgi:hypothetical protein